MAVGSRRSSAWIAGIGLILSLLISFPDSPVGASLAVSPTAADPGQESLEPLRNLIRGRYYADAIELGRVYLKEAEAANGPDSLRVAEVLDLLVEAMWRGEWREEPDARDLAERAVRIKEKILGIRDLGVATSLSNLASLLVEMGVYSDAGTLFDRVYEIRVDALGAPDSTVALTQLNLANVHRQKGNFDKAKWLYGRALWKFQYFRDHPHVATVLNGLAALHAEEGNYKLARRHFERALEIQEKVFGPATYQVAVTLNNLAGLFLLTGNHPEARTQFERARAIWETELGPDHIQVIWSVDNFAGLLQEKGDYSGARVLYESALERRERKLGVNNPGVASSLNSLAGLQSEMGDYEAARPLLERALAIKEKTLGPDSPGVTPSLNHLAKLLMEMGDYETARPLLERALAIRERSFSPKDLMVASSLGDLARLFLEVGDFDRALPLYERALTVREKTLGSDHPTVATVLHEIALLLVAADKDREARPLFERALAIREKNLSRGDTAVATTLYQLSMLIGREGEPSGARAGLERALALLETSLGSNHLEVASVTYALAELLSDTGDLAAARNLYERALAIREGTLGPDHPEVAPVLIGLGELRWRRGKTRGALNAALRAAEIGAGAYWTSTYSSGRAEDGQRYLSVNEEGLHLALSIAVAMRDSGMSREVWDALIRSRPGDPGGVGEGFGSLGESDDPDITALRTELDSTRTRMANLLIRGPNPEKPEHYRGLLEEMQRRAESLKEDLASASAAFRQQENRIDLGLAEVAEGLPENSSLVTFSAFRRLVRSGKELSPISSYSAFILEDPRSEPLLLPLGEGTEIDSLVSRWGEAAGTGTREGLSLEEETAIRTVGLSLRRKVWDPVATQVGDVREIFVILSGSLHLIDFGVLPGSEERDLLSQEPKFHYLSAERELLRKPVAD